MLSADDLRQKLDAARGNLAETVEQIGEAQLALSKLHFLRARFEARIIALAEALDESPDVPTNTPVATGGQGDTE